MQEAKGGLEDPTHSFQQQQHRHVSLLGVGQGEERREAAWQGPTKNQGRKNRQLPETDPPLRPVAARGGKASRRGCGSAARELSSPVSPARNADRLDDVDGDLAEEDEEEDEEAEGAVRPAGETAAVKPRAAIPAQTPSSERRETTEGSPSSRGKPPRGGDFRRNSASTSAHNAPSARWGAGSFFNTHYCTKFLSS